VKFFPNFSRTVVAVAAASALFSGCSGGSSPTAGVLPDAGPRNIGSQIAKPPTAAMIKTMHRANFGRLPADLNIKVPTLHEMQTMATGRTEGIHPSSSVPPGSIEGIGTLINGAQPYTGVTVEHSAYTTRDFTLAYPPGATGPQALFAPLTLSPNGGCFATSSVAINTGSQNYSYFVVLDGCSGPVQAVVATPIDDKFVNKYAYINTDGRQVYQTLIYTPDATVTPTSMWLALIWSPYAPNGGAWELLTTDHGNTGLTFGASMWATDYQPGPCSGNSASVVMDHLALLDPTIDPTNGGTFEEVQPQMAHTTSSIRSIYPNCFNPDASGPATNQFILARPNSYWRVARTNPRTATCATLTGVLGYYPCDLQSAYKLPSNTNGTGKTIAIVDAFDDPNAEADLAVYRTKFGLPSCSTANGCFKKIDQTGGATAPPPNAGWAQEISLDLDMASATCPNCRILLVEATDNSDTNLFAAVDAAASAAAPFHPSAISNSYGRPEYPTDPSSNIHFTHPGIAITASSGDGGYGPTYPAASPYLTAVGGTSLYPLNNVARGAYENAWNGAGSGCSLYETKPSFQHDAGCTKRTIADVSAVADPYTGVSVYDTYQTGRTSWLVFGGTSVSAPIIAGVYALNGSTTVYDAQSAYLNSTALFDVVGGSNGTCAPLTYLCGAVPGYDGPTGLGTPNGVNAFGGPTGPAANVSSANDTVGGPIRDVTSSLRSGHPVRVCNAAAPGSMACQALRLDGV